MITKMKEIKFMKIFALFALATAFISVDCNAAVVSRNNTQRPSASESRMPTMAARIESNGTNQSKKTSNSKSTTEKTPVKDTQKDTEEIEEETIIEDKTSQFDEILDDTVSSGPDSSSSSLAEKIRAQRAAYESKEKASEATQMQKEATASGKNACDQGLRKCMQNKCGKDYSKCAGDTDTIWGDKMDSCRRDLPCTGHEYALFVPEIKADRDMNARIAGYNAIIECGNSYNNCIFAECGTQFEKCLGKKAGDKAISKCEKIAKNCTKQDSGLPSRMMSAFGAVRQDAEKTIQRDEKRLYELRDAMRDTCKRLGAMFDERTLDCVYTVNFYAGDKNTLYASKKAYAGGTFSCDQNWFGVDITTFKENAFRATRDQKSATSALLGSGVGMAVGAVTSGAIDRAVDRHKADKALDKAQDEHCENYPDAPECADHKSKKKKDKKKEDKDDDKAKDKAKDKTEEKTQDETDKPSDDDAANQSTNTTYSGIITNEEGNALPYILVSITGCNKGTQTDTNGKWEITDCETDENSQIKVKWPVANTTVYPNIYTEGTSYEDQTIKISGYTNGSTVKLTKKNSSASTSSSTESNSVFPLSGTVTDETGTKLSGITVMIMGTASCSAVTDSNGKWNISECRQSINGNNKLYISSSDYQGKEITISSYTNGSTVKLTKK